MNMVSVKVNFCGLNLKTQCLSIAVIQSVSHALQYFNARLIRLVGQIKISLLLKIQRKLHPILYFKIVYKHNMLRKGPHLKGRGKEV
jgi:hypothetical protein